MIFKILAKILRKYLWLHLLIPLIFGLAFHSAVLHYATDRPWRSLLKDLVSFDTAVFISGVFLTYIMIMYHLVRKETSVRIDGRDLALLESTLAKAQSYFATSTIGMKEWFDPVSQVFLASIIKRKLQRQPFRDERVLLFCKRREVQELDSAYLDGYYAKRLSEIHVQHGTQLGCLSRSAILEILKKLSFEEVLALGCFPAWTRLCPDGLLRRIPISRMLPRLRQLDFALVEDEGGNKSVLLVSKEGENVRVRSINGDPVAPYAKLVDLIRMQVYKPGPGSTVLNEAYDFIKFFYPFTVPGAAGATATPPSGSSSQRSA